MESKIIEEDYRQNGRNMKLKTLISNAYSVCIISKSASTGTGFFLRIKKDKKPLYMLVTAYHVIDSSLISSNKTIEIIIEISGIKEIMALNKEQKDRIIICMKDEDITAIQIIESDALMDKIKFLDYDLKCNEKTYDEYLFQDIYSLHHPNGQKMECTSGMINAVREPKKFEFEHNLDTNIGTSGAPILLLDRLNENPKVIGVHTSTFKEKASNIGTFINVLIENIMNENYKKNKIEDCHE